MNPLAGTAPDSAKPRGIAGQAWLWVMPKLVAVLFLAAVAGFLWLLHRQDLETRRHNLISDILWLEQNVRFHLQWNEDLMTLMASEIGQGKLGLGGFKIRAEQQVSGNRELAAILWVDAEDVVRAAATAESSRGRTGQPLPDPDAREALRLARQAERPRYSGPRGAAPDQRFDVYVPAYRDGEYLGAVVGVYSVARVLHDLVPWWYAQRYHLALVDGNGQVVAAKSSVGALDRSLRYEIPFDPPGRGLSFQATPYIAGGNEQQFMLVGVLATLSLLMIWSLWMLRKQMARQQSAETALRGEYAFRKAMEDSLVTGLRARDLNGRITYVNPAFCRMVGFEERELVGASPPMPYWAPEEMQATEAAFNAPAPGGSPPRGLDLRFMRKNGERFDALVYESPLIDGNGRQTGWMATMVDITERKKAREALRASHERFVAVLDGLDAAVAVIDPATGELLYLNDGCRRLLGPGGIAGGRVRLPWQDEDEAVAEGDVPREAEVQDATTGRWYYLRSHRVKWVDGRQVRMEVATDVTERRQAEEISRQQLEKLQFTSRLVTMGEMASTLAHELNQPLSAIASYNTGCLNTLRSGEYDRGQLEQAMEKVGAQAQRAGKIIRSVHEFVRKRAPRRAPCDVNDVVEEAVGFVQSDARKRNVRVELDLAPDLPRILADRIMIEQVVLNLAKNAVEAMQDQPDGEALLQVRTESLDGGGVQVAVADTGPGVPAELRERLFTPFFTTKAEGMGMGLNICRSIVEFHRGRLWVEANAPRGAVFRFTLPD